jgi:N-acetylmuramoyl-L-alanine amidase
MDNPAQSSSSASRREVLHLGARAGSLLALSGIVAGLTGCNKANKRSDRSRNMIGQPIPEDPIYATHTPTPVYNAGGATRPDIAQRDLTVLPSFVIPRNAWTKGKTKISLADPMRNINRITIHHDAISPVPSGRYTDSVRRLAAIRNGHLSNRWADIGYHYAVDPAGRAWQARPLIYQGAHVKDNNPGNIGIVVFGNYEKAKPSSKALETLNQLIAHEMRRFNISMSRVYTHRELRSTACPGKHLQAQMVQLRKPNGALAMLVGDALHV